MKFNKQGAMGPMISNIIIVVFAAFFIVMFMWMAVENSSYPDSKAIAQFRNMSTDLNSTMQEMNDTAGDVAKAFSESKGSLSAGWSLFLIFEAAFEIPKTLFTLIIQSITVLGRMLFPSMGGAGQIIFGLVISGVIMWIFIEVVIAAIKFIRTGEGER